MSGYTRANAQAKDTTKRMGRIPKTQGQNDVEINRMTKCKKNCSSMYRTQPKLLKKILPTKQAREVMQHMVRMLGDATTPRRGSVANTGPTNMPHPQTGLIEFQKDNTPDTHLAQISEITRSPQIMKSTNNDTHCKPRNYRSLAPFEIGIDALESG